MNISGTHIASLASAAPDCVVEQSEANKLIQEYYRETLSSRSLSLIKNLLLHPSIKRRCFAVDRPETLLNENLDARMQRFTHWSVELSARAITRAAERAGIGLHDMGGLVVNTCTGYICPGISTYLIERLELSRTLPVYDLVGSGCGGAIPNIEICSNLLNGKDDRPVLSVSVEICTATFQMENDVGLLLSNALFSDGAAAAVLWKRPAGYELVASSSRYAPEHRDSIRYVHRNGQLHNQLSLKLPGVVAQAAAQVVRDILAPRSLVAGDIRHWALHSGGEKIINAVRDSIGLSEEQVSATRSVLHEYGNMSSPTVWFVLEEIERRGMAAGDFCMMLAFGAGLSAHGLLLRKN